MIAYIKGTLSVKTPAFVILETAGGIGYHINTSLHTHEKLPTAGTNNCKLYCHLHIKEDAHTLYGFFEESERDLFVQLISVSGVGPSTAQMMLSSLSPAEIQQAIVSNNSDLLKTVKGTKKNRVRRKGADLTLLPTELQNKSADNMILSLGLVYKKENPVILTLDRNFQSKAMMLEIPLVTIYELLGIKEEPRVKQVLKPQIDYIRIFKRMKPDDYGNYRISNFIYLIKMQYPSFNRSQLGFKSDSDFVLSLNVFMVSKDKAVFKLK